MLARREFLGSARISRVGAGVSPAWTFRGSVSKREVRFGETPKPTRETRALPDPLRFVYSVKQVRSAAVFVLASLPRLRDRSTVPHRSPEKKFCDLMQTIQERVR